MEAPEAAAPTHEWKPEFSPLDFRNNPDHVNNLRAFLASPTGRALREAVRGANPIHTLSHPSAFTPQNIRAAIQLQSDQAGLLSLIQGYSILENLLFDDLTHHTAVRGASKRTSPNIAPHRPSV